MVSAVPMVPVNRGAELMIHELRTLTVKAGLLADMLADSAAAREILSPHHGTMEGYWVADVGALNRV